MSQRDSGLSRRRALKLAGGAMVAGGVTIGATAAGNNEEVVIGLTADADFGPARAKADSVGRELDFDHVGKAISGRFSKQAIEALDEKGIVRYVEKNGKMHVLHHKDGHDGGPGGGGGGDTSQCLPWGVDRTDGDVASANGETGSGADVAIIDTGIDDDHPDLQANVGAGKAFVNCKGPNCNYNWSDDDDHGTHCAGIADAVDNSQGVRGVATEATLHAVKVLDKRGSGTFDDVAAGIKYTADQGWDVASMSLGASSGSSTVKDACQYAYDNGVLLVASAGNSGPCTDCVGYPAAYSTVIAVSSTDSDDSLSSFSSTGPEVELAAPGGSVYSTVIGGYDTFSGTSMSCPHVSGAGAMLMANGASNTNARDTLNSSAEDIGLGDNEQGSGLLDAAAALGLDSSDDGTGSC